MKLISSSVELKSTFIELMGAYSNISFATAWASMPKGLIEKLLESKVKIHKGVVGMHFYQTDPAFLEHFVDDSRVKTIWQSNGTFHPKMYLFYNSRNDWTLIIGSLNFTESAFSINTEAAFLVSAKEASSDIFVGAHEFIDRNWQLGEIITRDSLEWYRLRWNRMALRRSEFSDFNAPHSGYMVATAMMKLEWKDYVRRFEAKKAIVKKRFTMLELIRAIFSEHGSLYRMSEDERRLICGNPNELNLPGSEMYAHFGRSGKGQFMNKVINGNRVISDALDLIPLTGIITETDYRRFIHKFLSEGETTKGWVSSASRLLAVKRPDVFYCITDGNRDGFCSDFNISKSSTKDVNNYWKLVIQRIHDSNWYNNPTPQNDFELKLQNVKAAMLDMLYYY